MDELIKEIMERVCPGEEGEEGVPEIRDELDTASYLNGDYLA